MGKFLSYIHNLRGLAILFVVGVHAHGFDRNTSRLFNSIFDPSEGNGTLLFLFIGGFLFQHLTHFHFDFKKYIEQKFKVIILPYLIISIPLIIIRLYTGFDSLALPENFDSKPVTYQVVYYLITGTHMPPFWFISTIILIYFTAPLLHRLDNDLFYKFGFPILLVIFFFTYRPVHNANPIFSYIHFVPIYISGMWASRYKDFLTANSTIIIWITGTIYSVITLLDVFHVMTFSRDYHFEDIIYSNLIEFNVYALKALMLCFLLLAIFYKLRNKEMPVLDLLGHYSFGIFFVHYVFISLSGKILELSQVNLKFSLPIFIISFLFILLASTVVVYTVKRITGKYSRYLIGS